MPTLRRRRVCRRRLPSHTAPLMSCEPNLVSLTFELKSLGCLWLRQGRCCPASGLLPWLCPLPPLEQQQEVEGSWVLGDPTPKGKGGAEAALSIQPLDGLWVPPSVPKLILLTLELKSITRTIAPFTQDEQSPRKDSMQPQQPALLLPPPAFSPAGPCRAMNFRTYRMNSGGVAQRGLDTRARAMPEPAERAPNLTPLRSKAAAPHVHPFLMLCPAHFPGLPE